MLKEQFIQNEMITHPHVILGVYDLLSSATHIWGILKYYPPTLPSVVTSLDSAPFFEAQKAPVHHKSNKHDGRGLMHVL